MMWRSGPFFDPNRNQKPEQPTNLKILSPRLLPGTWYGLWDIYGTSLRVGGLFCGYY